MKNPDSILILGLGNVLCGDDAFGVLAAARLYTLFDFPENVEIADGGCQGQTLYGLIEAAGRLLVFDAADFGAAPGTLKTMRDAEIPMWFAKGKISPHQDSFSELLALAYLKNSLPASMALIAMQPGKTEFGEQPAPFVRQALPDAVELALSVLAQWNVRPEKARKPKHLLNHYILEDFA